MAVAYGSLQRWHEANRIWESIIRTCYASSYRLTQTTDFLDYLLPIVQQDENDYDRKKWQAVRDAINAERPQTPRQKNRVPDLVDYLDSPIMNILIDQQPYPWPVVRKQTAAPGTEISRETVVRVFLDRLSDVEITEQVFIAAASNFSHGQKLMDIMLDGQGQDAQITKAVLRSAAVNSRSKKTLISSLLGPQDIEVYSEISSDEVWEALSSLMLGSEPTNAKLDVLYLAKLYSTTDDTTLLRTLYSATDPLIIPYLRRGLYQFAWDEQRFGHLDELVQMLPSAVEDVIATITNALLSNDKHTVHRAIEIARRQRLDTTKTDMVNEEVVNGCSKVIETRSPAKLLQFLDCLDELGISFSCQGEAESPPTQSAILPATVSKDPRFLKILIEKKVVSPRMRPFTVSSHCWSNFGVRDEGVREERCPPIRMPDWPLYCAIILAFDSEFIHFLCISGARVDQDHPSTSPGGREGSIISQLEHITAFDDFKGQFRNLKRLCRNMAGAQLDAKYKEWDLSKVTDFHVSWENSFEQAWRSMDNMLQWTNSDRRLDNYDKLPERLQDEGMWNIWRNEILEILKSF
ncbi:hypothetical protein FVEG_17086 [Fusarium verticillioides 7600]|uniref:Uncharacterized protein n=1 Tax=Gibberella moniliformis (strain M3125 / FGSC 7600) TaxID=334819 RepID=W7N9T9_GIBM7|nr:hypothetical protein FVEG_17086 [Fusarium verticillioides 7600]EWG53267.1 hypothetical protein FVEG_17086 [Fusarium verticillioides 7600]